MSGCNCLCKALHPNTMGICRGEATDVVPFYAESTGHVEVKMCDPCAEEARKKKRRKRS